MELEAIVDDINSVPEGFRELYTERNGKFEITAIKGMKTQADVDRIQAGLVKERNDHKGTKERLAAFGDLDPTKIHEDLARLPELEMAAKGKLDDNKINEIVETRIKSRVAPIQRQLDQAQTQLKERDGMIAQFQEKDRVRKISDEVRRAGVSSKVIDSALEDALILAERVFEVGDDGKVVTKDNIGVTPGIDAAVWFQEMQTKRPHWWPASQGGGAGGGAGSGSGGTANPWTKDGWNMTKQGELHRQNPQRAAQLAKMAGTSIGGPRPTK